MDCFVSWILSPLADKCIALWKENIIKNIDDKMKHFTPIASTSIGVLVVGGGILYYFNMYSTLQTFRHYQQFATLYRKKLSNPAVFPVYVENPRTLGNISTQIQSGPGVLVLWGPPDSGKSSYAIRSCNKLLSNNEIGGVVKVNDSTFSEVDGDGGVRWFNTALGIDNLIKKNQKLSSIIPCNEPDDSWCDKILSYYFRRGKRVVILFDQFDNVLQHSNSESVLKFVKRLAEDSYNFNSYCVLLCVTNPKLAENIVNLNGRKKIRLLQLQKINYKNKSN